LLLLPAVAGREVVTVEGVARGEQLHPVQQQMADGGGSQCGYCTPGFVVSLFAEYYRARSGPLDEEAIAGNLCRCTGYRPIREAAERLAQIRQKEVAEHVADPHRARLAQPAPALAPVHYRAGPDGARFERPTTLEDALALHAAEPSLVPITGGTDLVVEVNQRHARPPGYLSLEAIPELRVLARRSDHLAIGAAVPLAELEERLEHERGALGDWPMLRELLPLFSSRLIRTRATLGGNLGTASPIGDSPPVLLALGAELVVGRSAGAGAQMRTIPIDEFFLDYRKTALARGELIVEVRLPLAQPTVQRFYKVSKRKMDDISTVAAAFGIHLEGGRVTSARLAYGGVAATPVRLGKAEASLVGQRLDAAALGSAAELARSEVSPMDDHRGSARYRTAMVGSLLEKLAAELAVQPSAPGH
jgi:xanthine dehydrogenase small subunit